jgi:predicted nucleic acid-binding Zn ribbon protein
MPHRGWNTKPGKPLVTQKKEGPKLITCPECGGTYFQQVEVYQFEALHTVIVGQRVAPVEDIPFYLLVCFKCGEQLEPNVQPGAYDPMYKRYQSFWEELEQSHEEFSPNGVKIGENI